MSDNAAVNGGAALDQGDHDEIHMPPNSWIPLSTSLALMMAFVGLLPPLGPWVGVAGMIWLAASLVAWGRAAVAEYRDLPESGSH